MFFLRYLVAFQQCQDALVRVFPRQKTRFQGNAPMFERENNPGLSVMHVAIGPDQ